jgi:protein-S-isoprenylcysteine O-methyltransferase Ste14
MEVLGKSTINPFLFYSGKIAGYFTWIVLLLSFLNKNILTKTIPWNLNVIAYIFLIAGLFFSILSLFTLGKSTRFGIPTNKTILKTGGLYKISRNPIYFGFDLMTISSILFLLNPIILAAGVFSMLVYHLIIIGEEQFLEKAFGADYLEYKKKVRRYL